MGIYLICFGESERNLNLALENNIIGIKQRRIFDENNKAYMLIKRSGAWTIVARANICGESKVNPFDEKYITYTLEAVEKCEPYGITELLKKEFGSTYGLTLRAPNLITNSSFIEAIDKEFLTNGVG